MAFFDPEDTSTLWIIINSVTDFLFFLDVLINFRTTYIEDKTTDEIFDPKRIAIQYLKGRFWIDIIASVPFDYVVQPFLRGDNNRTVLQMLGVIKLARILRLSRLISFMNLKDDVKMSLKLIRLIFFIVLYIHFVG